MKRMVMSGVFAALCAGAWAEAPLLETKASVNLFAIPGPLRGAKELFVKVKSFGYGADTCVGGFALCK